MEIALFSRLFFSTPEESSDNLAWDNFSKLPGCRNSSSCILNEKKWVNWVCFHLFCRIAGDTKCSTLWAEENQDNVVKLWHCSCKRVVFSMWVFIPESFAVHVHLSPRMHSHSWWIKLAGVMFCDKRRSLAVWAALWYCPSANHLGSKSYPLGSWKPGDVFFLGQ